MDGILNPYCPLDHDIHSANHHWHTLTKPYRYHLELEIEQGRLVALALTGIVGTMAANTQSAARNSPFLLSPAVQHIFVTISVSECSSTGIS